MTEEEALRRIVAGDDENQREIRYGDELFGMVFLLLALAIVWL